MSALEMNLLQVKCGTVLAKLGSCWSWLWGCQGLLWDPSLPLEYKYFHNKVTQDTWPVEGASTQAFHFEP